MGHCETILIQFCEKINIYIILSIGTLYNVTNKTLSFLYSIFRFSAIYLHKIKLGAKPNQKAIRQAQMSKFETDHC